jgi:regulator of RNase E activity RraA
MVIHDLDAPNPVGSWWGEVNGNVHRALGCVGVVTDGGVRDLSVVRPLGFHFFAAEVLVSHAYVHVVEFGKPVSVGGVTVSSGDLLQADEHGVIQVPMSVAAELGQACYDVFKSERALIEFCQRPGVTLEKMIEFVGGA